MSSSVLPNPPQESPRLGCSGYAFILVTTLCTLPSDRALLELYLQKITRKCAAMLIGAFCPHASLGMN